MKLTHGATDITIPNFNWGYETEVILPFEITTRGDRKISIWDAGSYYDKYSCKGKLILSSSEMDSFFTFYHETARGAEITLSECISTGFYPFTPAVNESSYIIYLDDIDNIGMVDDAGKFFQIEITFRWKFPTNGGASNITWNNPLTQCIEGNLSFAGVDNLIFPQSGFKPKKEYGVSVQNYKGSKFYGFNDFTVLTDRKEESKFELTMRNNTASNLIYRILNTYRGNAIPIQGADNYFIFGLDRGDNTLFSVKLNDSKIKIKHNAYNDFQVSFEVVKI